MQNIDFHQMAQLSSAAMPVAILLIGNDEDRQFASQIYLEHRQLMYKVAYRYFGNKPEDIEDAISVAAEDMCRYIENLRVEKCNNPQAYMLSIIGNACRRQLVAYNKVDMHRDYSTTQETLDDIPDSTDSYQLVFDYADAVMLLASLDDLSNKDKDLIRMRYIDRLTYAEIACRLQTSQAAARVALTRAKQRVQSLAAKKRGDLL